MANNVFYSNVPATDSNNATKWYNAAAYSGDNIQIIERTIDCSNLPTGFTKASGDTYQVFPILPGTFVMGAGIEVITADTTGSSPTLSLGDSASGTQFLNATSNPKATAGTIVMSAASTWKVYTAINYALVTINTAALTNAVFRVFMVCAGVPRSDNNKLLSAI